ncbi:MAG TPA: asparagine synthase (glutamine-hydrolyzing) [Thermoanaerobaculia bacterium]|nr:asparagine synthase (glutamine-hydrolyzing) [Thermoanaerobaculia bacterium]
MCGIAALFAYAADAPPVRRDEIERINDRMIPRGPDDGGIWIADDQRLALAARRLAIIDLSAEGAQPLRGVEGDATIVFNGEVYNHRELRARLEKLGVRFHSKSDTEVVLQMYRHYGADCVELLRGMFSFAIWDERQRRLFVARDAYGIKPLYFADDGKTFRCASTVKALLAGGAIARTRDPAGVAGFLMLGSVPEPFTIVKDIRAVEAGTSFFVDSNGRHDVQCYYSIASVFRHAREQQTIANLTTPEILLRELVTESVEQHLVSDVPVGVFLSAGIDSTTVAALAASRSAEPLRTVTILFDAFRDREFNETRDAWLVAESLGTLHTTRVVTREEFLSDLPDIFDAMDQPTIDGVNTWFVSKATAEQGLKVALSGVGGDELFGSYPAFKRIPKLRRVAGIPLVTKMLRHPKARAIRRLGRTDAGAYFLTRGLFLPEEIDAGMFDVVEHIGRVFDVDPGTDFGRVATLEASLYMRNQLLRDTDWASMAHSVEVRTPLIGGWLLRQLAPLLLSQGARCKQFFAASPERPLPAAIKNRRKTGFQTPLGEWLDLPPDGTSTRMRSWARRVLEHFA